MNDVENLPGMIGRHPLMLHLFDQARLAATSDLPVFVSGETGTGKELVARALHHLRFGPSPLFEVLDCSALPATLAEAELFGVERGAYTGAYQRRSGALERAHGGTAFLDEICSMPLTLQPLLLGALQRGEFRRVGGGRVVRSAFVIVAAASEPVQRLVAAGRLRRDLAYRLAGFELSLAPLRSRRSDIPLLAEHFLRRERRPPRNGLRFSPEALALLERYDWPGNVRELAWIVERLVLTARASVIQFEHVVGALGQADGLRGDRARLLDRLGCCDGNVQRAARTLGVARSTLRDWLRECDVRGSGRVGRPAQRDGDEVAAAN
jgi:DNA-binding NtrC family response regulator